MRKTDWKHWDGNANKDSFAHLAILIAGLLIVIAGAIDLPLESANRVTHVAYQQATAAR